MKYFLTASVLLATMLGAAQVSAKLPPLSDEAKAKAAEAAAKTAHNGKVDAYQLCKSMDQVAAEYFAAAKKAGTETKPPVATPPCVDPGPFVYAAPAAKPIEAAGAHSAPGMAVSPSNTKAPAAEPALAKKP